MSVSLISVVCAVGSISLSLAYLASDVIQFGSVCLLSGKSPLKIDFRHYLNKIIVFKF